MRALAFAAALMMATPSAYAVHHPMRVQRIEKKRTAKIKRASRITRKPIKAVRQARTPAPKPARRARR